MLAPAARPQRVRCRQIAPADLEALPDLLSRGFPRTGRDYWSRGLARLAALPPVEGLPRFGHVLESESGLVAAILSLPSTRPDGRILVNLSSWYVEPAWRTHSTLLVSMATRLRHVTYLNASPAPHTWRTLEAQGFKPFNFGRSAVFAAASFGGGRVSEIIPGDLPERDMLRAHAAMGCVSLVCEKDGEVSPFIFKPRRLERPPVRMMELIYCRAMENFAACAPALGRHLLRRGVLGFLVDGPVKGLFSRYVAGKEPRFYKGAEAPPLNDLAFTEKVIFG